eukprot:CAMPEP_0185593858 /NCGR_PEP_ID=MMETSP0434-20130131/72872_1 /TAXON_ID=626734 ORGANISM="Favella taraikaensis, Strain Fe Narragansett Bay" /NCGR_SAMPLE_ID=MMETSP0434 /ASSEMBLY_ACC=CAM_ASM_000379 /LENGTH=52 /DNA_ID=CAMNT_0028220777 /DNA_START=751 /DNA_END=906 /DNA_ORIENTATION=+
MSLRTAMRTVAHVEEIILSACALSSKVRSSRSSTLSHLGVTVAVVATRNDAE